MRVLDFGEEEEEEGLRRSRHCSPKKYSGIPLLYFFSIKAMESDKIK